MKTYIDKTGKEVQEGDILFYDDSMYKSLDVVVVSDNMGYPVLSGVSRLIYEDEEWEDAGPIFPLSLWMYCGLSPVDYEMKNTTIIGNIATKHDSLLAVLEDYYKSRENDDAN